MKIKISERATLARNELLLLQNEGPVCGRPRPFQDCTERQTAAVVGSNQLTSDCVDRMYTQSKQRSREKPSRVTHPRLPAVVAAVVDVDLRVGELGLRPRVGRRSCC